jgi:phosphoglycolate phosphatase-like HAD superfamily hydrolase
MRERLLPHGEENLEEGVISLNKEIPQFERHRVLSLLEGPNGENIELSVAISKEDGELRETNFWDLDRTLLLSDPLHAKAVDQIFPEHAKDEASRRELHRVYFDGFSLGNSSREWDRMWRIYGEGQLKYKNPLVYEVEFLGTNNPKQKLIDEPGHSEGYHERANEILQQYGKIAYEIMKTEYEKDPEEFQKGFIKPEMIQLLQEKTRLGQANVYMTANQADFARGLIAFSDLYKYGLALATDETMTGGGKEIAIEKLIEQLDDMGLKVNKKRAVAIGDSIKGDVGSGVKAGLGSGLLVTETSEDVRTILDRTKPKTQNIEDLKDAEELKSVLRGAIVEAILTKEIKQSKTGIFHFGKKSSNKQE